MLSVVATGTVQQILFGLMVQMVFIKLYAYNEPYNDPHDASLQEVCQYQVFFLLLAALLIREDAVVGSVWSTAMDVVLGFVVLSSLGVGVLFLLDIMVNKTVVAAGVGGGAVIAWRAYRQRRPSAPRASANPDVNLDVGETVHIEAWDEQGHASVKYRGANWQVVIAPGVTPVPGACTIVEVLGNRLIVRPA